MLNKITNSLFKTDPHNIFKGIFTLAKGAILARIIGLASIPILTRLYSPEDFGVLAFFTSIIAILAPVLTLRYVQAIPLPKSDAVAVNLFSLSFMLILINSVALLFVFTFFGERLFVFFGAFQFVNWWPLLVLGAAATALYELFSLWATRKKEYKLLAKTQIYQSLFGSLTKVVLGVLAMKALGLITGQITAQLIGVISFTKKSYIVLYNLKPKIQRHKIIFIARYYSGFPIYRLPAQILMISSVQAPILMVSALYGENVTGQLSLALLALSLPSSLIGAAVAKAYYAEIAQLGKNNIPKIRAITYLVQKKLLMVSVPLTLLVMLTSEFIFGYAFGDEWVEAGRYASILAPFILFQFTSAPLMEVLNIVGSQANFLILHLFRFTGLVGVFYYTKYFPIGINEFILLISLYLSLFYLLASAFVFYSLKRQ